MLKTWITGTKDFTDQGLAPSEWINDNVTIVDGGKLGKCMYFNGTSSRLSTTGYTLSNKWSWSCWVKEDPSITAWQLVIMLNSSGSDGDSQTALWLKANEHRFEVCNNTKYNSTIQYTQGQWNHYAMSFDGTTTKAYLNGSQVATFTSSTIFSKTNLTIGAMGTNANGGHVSASYYLKGYINDLRIWDDEVISPLQVKRLSQGLILHYCLDNNGVGGENNIAASKITNRACSSFAYDASTNEWSMTCPSGSTAWGTGIYINDNTIKWGVNETWVVSMDVYVPKVLTWNMDINNKPDVSDTSQYTGNDYDVTSKRYTYTNGISSKTLKAGWNKIWFSQTAPTTYGLTNYTTNWGIVTTNETSAVEVKIKNIKGEIVGAELPIHPTPWCPNSSDTLYTTLGYNDNIEYDTSGFGNNGTRVGEFNWSSDTPRYLSSMIFEDDCSQYIHTNHFSNLTQNITMSCWVYQTSATATSGGSSISSLFIMSQGRDYDKWGFGIRTISGVPNLYITTTSNYQLNSNVNILNGWHHLVATYDGLNAKIYVDGILKATQSISGDINYIYDSEKLVIGKMSYGYTGTTTYFPFVGNISDVRVYATALSAEDILSLYQASAYIDSHGNTFASSYVEG